jgi:hypothetical protein
MSGQQEINLLIQYAKDKQYELEETSEHFANNFSILEPNNYDDDEVIFKKETIEQSAGYSIIYI